MIKLKSLITEYRKAVILSPSKAKKLIATIKKQERVSKVFKHKASYDGKMTTIYSIRARNKSHYSGNNPYGLDMSRDSKGGSYLIRVHEGIITEAAWFTNLRKDGKEWMMDVNGKPTELDKLLGIKGDKAQLYFLSDDNVPDYGRYWAIEREAIKNAKGYSSSTMKVGMKLIPMKELRVWGKAARQLIFIPLKGKDSVGKDITRKYKKVK